MICSFAHFGFLHNACMKARCWSLVITRTTAEVELGFSAVLHQNPCNKYVANIDGSEMPACILGCFSRGNVHCALIMSYSITE
jgi:hypothetical protein